MSVIPFLPQPHGKFVAIGVSILVIVVGQLDVPQISEPIVDGCDILRILFGEIIIVEVKRFIFKRLCDASRFNLGIIFSDFQHDKSTKEFWVLVI